MKNTKLTQNLDNSKEQQDIQSPNKRKILASIGVTSGIIGASALSQQWTKPIVNSIVLPAHAQATDMMATTMAPTMAPTTMAPMMIMVSTDSDGMIGDGNTGTAGMVTYQIRLNHMPTNDVMVAVTASDGATVTSGDMTTFTLNTYSTWMPVTVTADASDVDEDTEVTVTFKASGGGYDDVMTEQMLTVINDDAAPPTMVEAKAGDFNFTANTADVTVTWKHPNTSAERRGYVISSDQDKPEEMRVGPDVEMVEFKGVPAGAHIFSVMVDFKEVDDATVMADSITIE